MPYVNDRKLKIGRKTLCWTAWKPYSCWPYVATPFCWTSICCSDPSGLITTERTSIDPVGSLVLHSAEMLSWQRIGTQFAW